MSDYYQSFQTMADIQRLIDDEIRESVTIEYKEAAVKWDSIAKEKIAKQLSAFANSEGGTIFYGIECDKNNGDKPVAITGLHPKNTAEVFQQIAADAVRPVITGLQCKPVPCGEHSVLVVSIPRSDSAPHMSQKHKQYFHRSGSHSLAMEHYMVEMYFGKRRKPHLEMRLIEPDKLTESPPGPEFTSFYPFQLVIANAGKRNAPGCSGTFTFRIPGKAKRAPNSPENAGTIEKMPRGFHEKPDMESYSFEVAANVYPGAERCLYISKFAFKKDWLRSKMDGAFLEWELYTDGMEPQHGDITLSETFINLLPSAELKTCRFRA
jgi:hypothetical protein